VKYERRYYIMEFGKWIKASEQLPPIPNYLHPQKYLATVVNNQVVSVNYVTTKIRNKEVTRWEHYGKICPWEVIAWMVYPEPYKED
jgi:hypothetical protein